ncbi:ribokinase [Iamia sp. SCSIO 61187]|uniref:ribokinase n=1 Tax=Iamia sp. SCSIO 61187 TaxID=2722752 RepID=UPI001C62F8C5|nr:ribokinase [Iamia sp. SCSIO 61187]QYG91932.1 ribokinase [Iamia sp. SCSIO 61187]
MGRVVVVGSINDDLVVVAGRLPGPGETVAGTSVSHSSGGKGANQAVAAARAGAPTLMVGGVGRDEAGDRLRAGLRDAGVDTAGVRVVDGPTGVAIVTVAGGENTIVVVAGANARLDPHQVEAVAVAPGDVVVAQLETPTEATVAAFGRARSAGAVTVLNPAPAAPVPGALLDLVDHLVVNEHEVELVLGVAAADLVADRGDARQRLRAACRATVHLTLGADGQLVLGPDMAIAVPGRAVEVVDSTGAGDCFTGSLAAGLAAGVPLEAAVRRAGAAASLSVTRPGAAPSMPTAAEVDAVLA